MDTVSVTLEQCGGKMAAQWRLLIEHLRRAGDKVTLTWSELDAIVGGLPASAVDHYPQWWHGDRPNTRAWRAAGYEATKIDPGVAATFVRARSAPGGRNGNVSAAPFPEEPRYARARGACGRPARS